MAASFSRHLVLAALISGVLRDAPLAASVQDDQGTWRVLPPFTRTSHGAAYDPTGHRVFVFGGSDRGGGRNDLWALNLTGPPAWIRMSPGGAPPTAGPQRLIYDPVRNRLLAFNGTNTWALPLEGGLAWSLVPVAGASPGIAFSTATYDPLRDRMLVFGGSTTAGTNQLYALSLSGTPTWSVLSHGGHAAGASVRPRGGVRPRS